MLESCVEDESENDSMAYMYIAEEVSYDSMLNDHVFSGIFANAAAREYRRPPSMGHHLFGDG